MRVEEVKTRFTADTQKYIRDIQRAQKALNTFLRTDNMTQKEKAEYRLQTAIQRRAQMEAKALMQELRLKQQVEKTNSRMFSSVNKSISKSASSSKMFGGELAHLARNVMTLYYSFKSLSKVLTTGIDFNRTKENARLAFTVMFRSADVATQKIKELQEYAIASPLSFKETISASKQLSAYGFGADTLVQNMEMLGTVAKATGHSLDDIAYVYGTLKTQGQAYARDLMQFSMRGIPIYEELAEVLKVDQKEVKQLVTDGKVGFKEIEKAFKNMTKEGGKFGGLLDEYMQGFEGIASQLEDTFQQSMGQMTEPMFEALKTQVEILIRTLDSGEIDKTFDSIGKVLADVVARLGNLVMEIARLTPVLIAFFKAWAGYIVIFSVIKAIKNLIVLIPIFTRGMIKAAIAVRAFSSGTMLSSMTAGLKMMGKAFVMFTNSVLTALSGFAKAAWGIIAANPLLATILGIMAVGATIAITVKHKRDEEIATKRQELKKAGKQAELLSLDIGRFPDPKSFKELGVLGDDDFLPFYNAQKGYTEIMLNYGAVLKVAEAYKISNGEAANLLHTQGLISDAINTDIQTAERGSRDYRDYMTELNADLDLMLHSWLEGTTGASKGAYSKDREGNSSTWLRSIVGKRPGMQEEVHVAMGGIAAEDYLNQLEQSLLAKKESLQYIWQDMFTPDMMKENIESAIEQIETLLTEGSHLKVLRGEKGKEQEVPWFNLTGWDEAMRKKLAELYEQLNEGLGGAGGKDPVIEIKLDPWFDREKMASATKMIFDDLELQRDKDFANAQAKLDAQEISFEQYSRAINAIHTKYLDDRIEAEKEAVEKTMNLWREGSDDVWRDIGIEAHKELFAFLGDTRPIQNLWAAFTNGASRAVSSTINAFGHIKDLLSSFENPFSIGTSSSPIGIKIDIDKDVLESNAGNMWDKMVIFGNYIKDGFTIFKNNLSLFKESIIEFKESVLILGKNVAIEMIKGTQVGNVFSSASQYKADFLQKKKDEWIESGRDAGDFNEDFALAEGRSMGTYDQEANIKGSILTQAVMAFAEMALSVENVTKVLNPFGTMMEAAGTFLQPLLSVGFSGIASALEELGKVVGKVLLPVIMPLMIGLQTIAGVIKIIIIPILQTVGGAFAWLYDSVLVPFGNFVIDAINGLINILNMIPWIDIEKLERFQTTAQMLADSTDSVNTTMQYMLDKLNKMIDDELQSLQDLYEVGAISGAELQSQTDALNLKRLSLEENLVDANVAQMEEMQAIYDWLVSNGAFPDITALLAQANNSSANTSTTTVSDANVPGPSYVSGLSGAGELAYSGTTPIGPSMVSNEYYITVQGSVTSENDLADTLAGVIEQRRIMGYGRR